MSRPFTAPKPVRDPKLLIPEDTHIARLYILADIGTHKSDWKGEEKLIRKVVLTWELPECKRVFKEGQGEQPYVTSETYTLSMGKKSNLRADVEAWRGKALTDEEANSFDISCLIGMPCFLTIGHEDKNGNTYANIMGITKIPKGVECPPAINEPVVYQIEDGEGGSFSKLPKWIQEKIRQSMEFTSPASEDEYADAEAKSQEEKDELPM